jgi:hypothetical protein
MPRGARPGERRGGRAKGTRNKITLKKAVEIEQKARVKGVKLGKEILSDLANVFYSTAAAYQPAPPGRPEKPGANAAEFLNYARLAMECAAKLAPYESPTFRSVIVAPAPDHNTPHRKQFTLHIFDPPPKQIEARVIAHEVIEAEPPGEDEDI